MEDYFRYTTAPSQGQTRNTEGYHFFSGSGIMIPSDSSITFQTRSPPASIIISLARLHQTQTHTLEETAKFV